MANKNNFDVDGKIIHIYQPRTVGKNNDFTLQEFIVEVPVGNYDDPVKFQFNKQNVGILSGFAVGDRVQINFRLRGNESNKEGNVRWYTNLEALNISKL